MLNAARKDTEWESHSSVLIGIVTALSLSLSGNSMRLAYALRGHRCTRPRRKAIRERRDASYSLTVREYAKGARRRRERKKRNKRKKTDAFVHRVAESEPTGDHASLDSRQPTIKI